MNKVYVVYVVLVIVLSLCGVSTITGCNDGNHGNPAQQQQAVVKEYRLPPLSATLPGAVWKGMATAEGRLVVFREEEVPIFAPVTPSPTISATYEVLRSDDGVSWDLVSSGQDNERFVRLDFLTKDHGWMARITTPSYPFKGSFMFETTDGGKTWTRNVAATATGEVYVLRFGQQGEPKLWLSNPLINAYITAGEWDGQQWNQFSTPSGVSTHFPPSVKRIDTWSDLGLNDDMVVSDGVNFERSFFSSDARVWHVFLDTTPMPKGVFRTDDEVIRYGKAVSGLPLALGKRGMVVPGNIYILYRDLHRTLGGLDPVRDPVNSGFIYKGNIWIGTKDGEVFYSPDDGRNWGLLYAFPRPQGRDASFLFARDDKTISVFERYGDRLIRHEFSK